MSYYMMDGAQAAQVAAAQRSMMGYGGYDGLGRVRLSERAPFSLYGLGAVEFNAGTVWQDWLAGAKGDNAAGMRAANAIRAALSQLGFGATTMGVSWGSSQDKAAYGAFASKEGIPAPPGLPLWWPSQTGIIKLEELVKAGQTVGAQPVTEFHEVAGKMVPGPAPGVAPVVARPAVAKAGLTTGQMLGLGALALVAVGAIALLARRKPERRPPSPPSVTVTETIPRPHAKPITETVRVR